MNFQWFGNLVTMKDWTDLWLKEGVANYLESFVPEQVNPEEKMVSQICK